MGRELRRVALDFVWPVNKVWSGFVNPHDGDAESCSDCDGSGWAVDAIRLRDRWYGRVPFNPADRGSVAWTSADPEVIVIAERNVKSSPEFYGASPLAVSREACRLAEHFNTAWCHHLNDADVLALVESGRLMEFTHTWSREDGWKKIFPEVIPSSRQVNAWSLSGLGHDSLNAGICIRAECGRLGVPYLCTACNGEAEIWPSAESKATYENWQRTEPPAGEGYQIWETVSEGSPISPVFATDVELAEFMASQALNERGKSFATWLAFIRGPGWAPSMVLRGGAVIDGVDAMVAEL